MPPSAQTGRGSAPWRRRLLLAAVILAPAALARGCVLATYAVRSASMEPAVLTGDHLLVIRDAVDFRPLRRWDVTVLDRTVDAEVPEDFGAVVKRVAGLPGEFVEIRGGDVWTGPAADRLELAPRTDEVVASMLVPVHASDGLAAPWSWTGELPPERLSEGGVLLSAPGVAGTATYGRALRDGTLDAEGTELVADTALRLVVDHLDGTLLLGLREGVDLYRARLASAERGGASLHHNLAAGPLVSEPGFEGLAPGAEVLFWNVDDRLRVFVDGRLVLSHDVGRGTPQAPGTTLLNTPEIGVEGGSARLARVEVLRDVHYGAQGSYAHPGEPLSPYKLPSDGLFVLGDASVSSRDSRHFGPVNTDSVLGRPVATYQPWDRARWLSSAGVSR